MPRINFKAADIEPVPKDHYQLEVQSMEMKAAGPGAKHPGSPFIETWFVITQLHKDFAGRKIPHNFSLLPQSGWVLKDFLEKLNVPHDAIPGAAKGEYEIGFNSEDCIGKVIVADVQQVTYQKKDKTSGLRNEIEGFVKA